MQYEANSMKARCLALLMGSHGVLRNRRRLGEDRTRPETEAG